LPHLAPFPWVFLPASSFTLTGTLLGLRLHSRAFLDLLSSVPLPSMTSGDGAETRYALHPLHREDPGGLVVDGLGGYTIQSSMNIYIPMISLCFPYYFQMISLLFPYSVLIIYLLFTYYFHIGSHYFLLISLLYPHNFPIIKLCSYYFPIVSLSFLFGWLNHGFNHHFRIFLGPITNSVDMIRSSFQQVSSAILVV
jgi:hypothetical protein